MPTNSSATISHRPKRTSGLNHPVWFILPSLLGLITLTYLPTLASAGLSFTRWDLLGSPQWVGLSNYTHLFSDPLFYQVMGTTSLFVIFVALGEIVLATVLAVWVNGLTRTNARLQRWFQTLFFLPVIAPLISVSLVWGWFYDPAQGLLNALLQASHLLTLLNDGKPIAWLYQPSTVLGALIVMQIWKNVGYAFLIVLAGLQTIPSEVLQAARLDGTTSWQRFWYITLPLLTPTLFFLVTVTLINSFQTFDSIYLLTQGGPNHASNVMVHWLFQQAFQWFNVGQACALAVCLFVIILALTLIQWRIRKQWVFNE